MPVTVLIFAKFARNKPATLITNIKSTISYRISGTNSSFRVKESITGKV